ncbi:2'-5' RNA ligase family protein [Ramlibacter humi]|uniref:2'-5' RNA ligase family protein n=1 Tax=Ramlibacter humi TaxID=2530451 RepID=UPI0014307C5B|nr:2'-5' RNA ligase family protein [Ramlibacter humi]
MRRPALSRKLLIALRPGRASRDAIQACQDQWTWPEGTWVTPPYCLHLTLACCHATREAEEVLHAALAGVPFQPFRLRLHEVAAWRGKRWPAVFLAQPNHGLDQLRHDVRHALLLAGFPVWREKASWRPHVTLGYDARGARCSAAPPTVDWPVREFFLIHSHDGLHDVLHRYATAPGGLILPSQAPHRTESFISASALQRLQGARWAQPDLFR